MKKLFLALAVFALGVSAAAAQAATETEDFQSWNDVQITAPMSKRVDFILTGTARFGDNLRKAVDQRLSIAFNLKINDWLSVQPSYTHISTTPVVGRNRIENRLSFAATYKFPFKNSVFPIAVCSSAVCARRRIRRVTATDFCLNCRSKNSTTRAFSRPKKFFTIGA
jgi:hypothetical protein